MHLGPLSQDTVPEITISKSVRVAPNTSTQLLRHLIHIPNQEEILRYSSLDDDTRWACADLTGNWLFSVSSLVQEITIRRLCREEVPDPSRDEVVVPKEESKNVFSTVCSKIWPAESGREELPMEKTPTEPEIEVSTERMLIHYPITAHAAMFKRGPFLLGPAKGQGAIFLCDRSDSTIKARLSFALPFTHGTVVTPASLPLFLTWTMDIEVDGESHHVVFPARVVPQSVFESVETSYSSHPKGYATDRYALDASIGRAFQGYDLLLDD